MSTQSYMRREILEIPHAVETLLGTGGGAIREAAAALRDKDPEFIISAARGSSDHAALYFKYACELVAGIPVASVGPSIASIYVRKLKLARAASLAISQSGKSPDIVRMAEMAASQGALSLSLTNNPDSDLALVCEHTLPLYAGVETSVAATKTFVNSVVSAIWLLAQWQQDADLLAAIFRLPKALDEATQMDWGTLAREVADNHSLFCLGRGAALAVSHEAALKFKETCRLHAESHSSAEVLHGPVSIIESGFTVLAFAAHDAAEGSVVAVADALVAKGARVFITSDQADAAQKLPVARTGHPLTDPISIIVSFYAMVEQVARARGMNPTPRPILRRSHRRYEHARLSGAEIFDGIRLHQGKALLLDGSVMAGICDRAEVPSDCQITTLTGGTVLPGFVDLQVNGGGGVMFNDETSLDGLVTIAEAHARTGTRAFLPTLITDTPERTHAAVDAVEKAIAAKVPGIVGIHLEGPHLSIARKGAHAPALIRKMKQADEDFLVQAANRLPNVLVTVAPENVTPAQIRRLAEAGVIVSLGHTDCSMDEAMAAFDAGARCVTHLFNAMSQLGSRAPGLVGATLRAKGVSAGLIADDIHVNAASIGIALDAKAAPGAIFLVTDAMATAGSEITEFQLNGRKVLRRDGRLTLEDGTLAGADLQMSRAIRVITERVGVAKADAFTMATSAPAQVLNNAFGFGRFAKGAIANAVWLDDDLMNVRSL